MRLSISFGEPSIRKNTIRRSSKCDARTFFRREIAFIADRESATNEATAAATIRSYEARR